MGSFSYSCQLSGLPITSGTKCAILPMLPRDDFYDNGENHFRKFGKSMFCSNTGVNVFFNEFSFPIFGDYDDYGGLENIVKDDNTKSLEEYFELSIEDICTVLCDGRKDEYSKDGQFCKSVKIINNKNDKHKLLLKMSLSWFHGDFYKNLSIKKSPHQNSGLDLGSHGLLLKLGFTFIGETPKERYNLRYEKDGLEILSDGNWLEISNNESVYNLNSFQKYCKKYNVDINTDVVNMGYYEQIYECILPTLKNLESSDRWATERVVNLLLGDIGKVGKNKTRHTSTKVYILENRIEIFKKEGEDVMDETIKSLDVLENMLKDAIEEDKKEPKLPKQSLTEFYFDKIKKEGNGFLKLNIVEWFKIKNNFYPLGKYLYPIGTSPQDGDYESVKIFYETSLDTINDIIKQRKSEGYYEDELEEELN